MKRSERIDYKILNSTGKRVVKFSDTDSEISNDSNSPSLINESIDLLPDDELRSTVNIAELSAQFDSIHIQEVELPITSFVVEKMSINQTELLVAEKVIADDIDDYIDENPLEEESLPDLEVHINKIEEFRTRYREKHNEFKIAIGNKSS